MLLISKYCLASSFTLLATIVLGQIPASAAQLSLDWGDVAQSGQWPNGTQNGNFNIGSGNVDISFQVGDGIQFIGFGNSGLTPAVSPVLNGAKPDDDPALHLQIDAERVGLGDPRYSAVMNTTFSGYGNLENVSFLLHDIDIIPDMWQDRVIIQGFLGGQRVDPIFNPISNSIEIEDAFTLDGAINIANDSNLGDVEVSFSSAIDQFSLIYTDGDDTSVLNPSGHGIGIGDIYFTVPDPTPPIDPEPIPEPSVSLAILLAGVCLPVIKSRTRRCTH